MSARTMIEVNGLSKCYRLGQVGAASLKEDLSNWWHRMRTGERRQSGEFWALRDLSFQMKEGEVLGIIGKNGAGKSTLLKILSRITEPTSGHARLYGNVSSLLEVGTGFHPDLTGRENIYLNGAIMGLSRRDVRSRLDEIIEFAGVSAFADTPVKRYSSGMHVRLGFAVAAHLEPDIMIIDEVLAVGDIAFQRKCLGKMDEVARSGRTILFVSHNMSSIAALCNRGLLIENGSVRACGEVKDVVNEYLAVNRELHKTGRTVESALFSGFYCTDARGERRDTFAIGEEIRLHLCVSEQLRAPAWPQFMIAAFDEMGNRMFTTGSDFTAENLLPLHGGEELICQLPFAPLMPGRYFLKLYYNESALGHYSQPDIPAFTIAETDFYGTGQYPGGRHGCFVQPAKWSKSKSG